VKGPLNQLHDIYLAHWIDFWGIPFGLVLKIYLIALVREVGLFECDLSLGAEV
jgi:hypothetical protein